MATCTNNKYVFLCILRHHVREGHLQYLQKLQADLTCEDESEAVPPTSGTEEWLARNDSISCELGIQYPVVQTIWYPVLQASHMEVLLVFFSTFETISLTPDSCMQLYGIPMLY